MSRERLLPELAPGGLTVTDASVAPSTSTPLTDSIPEVRAFRRSTPPDLVRTVGTSLVVIGVMLLLGHVTRPGPARAVRTGQAILGAAGSMTLTFYSLHVLFLNSPLDTYSPVTGYVVQVVAVLLLGLAWRASVGRGPLESLVGTLSLRAQR